MDQKQALLSELGIPSLTHVQARELAALHQDVRAAFHETPARDEVDTIDLAHFPSSMIGHNRPPAEVTTRVQKHRAKLQAEGRKQIQVTVPTQYAAVVRYVAKILNGGSVSAISRLIRMLAIHKTES